jgi:hypothetical protein
MDTALSSAVRVRRADLGVMALVAAAPLCRRSKVQFEGCACRKLRPCRLSRTAILVDDSAETIPSIYGEAFDLVGFNRLRRARNGAAAASDR